MTFYVKQVTPYINRALLLGKAACTIFCWADTEIGTCKEVCVLACAITWKMTHYSLHSALKCILFITPLSINFLCILTTNVSPRWTFQHKIHTTICILDWFAILLIAAFSAWHESLACVSQLKETNCCSDDAQTHASCPHTYTQIHSYRKWLVTTPSCAVSSIMCRELSCHSRLYVHMYFQYKSINRLCLLIELLLQ